MEKIKEILKHSRKPMIIVFVSLILISCGMGAMLEKIEVGNIVGITHTIENFLPDGFIANMPYMRWIFIILLIVVIVSPIWYMKQMILVCHTSFSPETAMVDKKEIKKDFIIKEQKIDLCDCMSRAAIGEAVAIQDDIIKKISEKRNREIGYYGVAHTPFVFRAGYQIGDQRKIHLFHRTRDNKELSFICFLFRNAKIGSLPSKTNG